MEQLAPLTERIQRTVEPEVHRFTHVVNRVTDDRLKILADWLFGPVGQAKTIRIGEYDKRAPWPINDLVQVFGQGRGLADKRINVAIGPFDL